MDMDPEAAAARATGREVNREAAEEQQRDDGTTEDSSSESSTDSLDLGEMLRSTQPEKSPRQASGFLDFSAPWHAHAEVGLEKATNAGGTPAWVHLLMAAFLLLASEFNLPMPTGDSSDGPDDGDRGDDADGAGPEGGVHAI